MHYNEVSDVTGYIGSWQTACHFRGGESVFITA